MADDLSAPLGRRKTKPARFSLKVAPAKLPLARLAFGAAALIILGVAARILLVNDPMGGRPVTEIGVNSTHNANTLAGDLAKSPGQATITAGPEMPASGASISMVGADVPDGTPAAPAMPAAGVVDPATASAQGLVPDLLEDSEHGAIPRVSATGITPFDAYSQPSPTLANADGKPLIAIVVTGLGLNTAGTASAIEQLPGPVTLAFAPYGKSLPGAVGSARAAGHEVLLEMPLEPFDYPQSDPGPDTLLTGQAPRDNLNKLFTVMGKFGGYVGLINHMGARFTASTADFSPIMEELGARGLGYVDDGSSPRSVAPQLASANAVEFGRADIALDQAASRQPIMDQLKALEDRATQKGSAIGVISALPVSIETLAAWAKTAQDRGFTIVPISALMKKTMKTPNRETMPYRDCVGTAVFNDHGLVLIGRRRPEEDPEDTSESAAPWQMPQGGIDKGEKAEAAAMRELFEETSIRSVEQIAEAPGWIYYDLPDEALGIALKGKYRGQRQRWFAFRFTGDESEINVLEPGDGSMPAEFDQWHWEELGALPDLIVPFKRDAYVQVVAAFSGLPAKLRGK